MIYIQMIHFYDFHFGNDVSHASVIVTIAVVVPAWVYKHSILIKNVSSPNECILTSTLIPRLFNVFIVCTNFEYDPNKFQMSMNVMMNDNQLYENMFSARNPPPICVPIPVPYIPVMADMCLKFFNIFMPGRNMHMCMDMETRLQRQPILV